MHDAHIPRWKSNVDADAPSTGVDGSTRDVIICVRIVRLAGHGRVL